MGKKVVGRGQRAEGREWNQERGIRNLELGNREKTMNEKLGLRVRYTWDIIEAAEMGLSIED